jgi:hypothetical protein
MKTLPLALLALALVSLPLTTACFPCEGGPAWHRYAEDVAAVTLDAGTTVRVPLTISASTRPSSDPIVVEIGMTDCSAGTFSVQARMLREDGTELDAVDGFTSASSSAHELRCPTNGVAFEIPAGELACADGRCRATVEVELRSATGVGPREIEARLVTSECRALPRNDGAIDAWGE